ncbi:MAG: homoserine O-acetyltransferase [Candidatus Eremiobacteraeota bacterium]|nr:homoserine O-acetyltransferase [Candidatus Eremiobacteraeota bacterium]
MAAPRVERTLEVGPLELLCGGKLERVEQFVSLEGELRDGGANAVLVPHALTGSAQVRDWWDGLAGPGKLLDPSEACIIGINVLGGCYGSTGPASPAPDGKPYGSRWPLVTVRDMVEAQYRALRALGVRRLAAVVGGSLGGMQALEWALDHPEMVEHAIPIGAYDHFSAFGIAYNRVALEAIRLDGNFRNGDYYDGAAPMRGLKLARKIAMITYKSDELFTQRFERRPDRKGENPFRSLGERFDVEGYLDEQGDRLTSRFDANTYIALSRAMDLFETRDRKVKDTRPKLTFVGISSDILFLPQYVRAASERMRERGFDSQYLELVSDHGHDAFLADTGDLARLLRPHVPAFLTATAP